MTVFSYARVSTDGQTLAAQDAALRSAGCAKIYSETGVRGENRSRRPAQGYRQLTRGRHVDGDAA